MVVVYLEEVTLLDVPVDIEGSNGRNPIRVLRTRDGGS